MDATAHVGVDETCLRLRTHRWRRLPARGMGLLAPWQAPPRSLRDLGAEQLEEEGQLLELRLVSELGSGGVVQLVERDF